MLQALREFASYLFALWREGKALIMGGGLFAGIAIWGLVGGRALPTNIGYLALGITFIVAGFLAWRKEVQENARLHGIDRPGLIFVDEKPSFLTQFFSGDHTSIQAAKLVQPYLGKWVKLSDIKVDDISERANEHVVAGIDAEQVLLIMYFSRQWDDRISILRRGSKIAIVGQISHVQNHVRLTNCELTDSGPPPAERPIETSGTQT